MRVVKEKLISIGGKQFPKFNQIIFLAGGAGSGKGFLSRNLLGIEGRVIDTDAISGLLSKALVPSKTSNKEVLSSFFKKLRDLIRNPSPAHDDLVKDIEKHGGYPDGVYTGKDENKDPWVLYKAEIEKRISDLEDNNTILADFNPLKSGEFFNPKDARDVSLRYRFKKSLASGIEDIEGRNDLEYDDKQLISMVVNAPEGRRPNIIIDTTLSSPDKIKKTLDTLNMILEKRNKPPIDPMDVSIVWILAPLTKAIQQNFSRDRSVGITTLYDTHVKSTKAMREIFGNPDVFSTDTRDYVDGDIIIIFNNGENIKFNYEIVKGKPVDHDNALSFWAWSKNVDGKLSDDDLKEKKSKSDVGYVDQYCACYVKHRGEPITPLSEISKLPIVGGRKGSEPMTVGNLLDLYTMPAMLVAHDREIQKIMGSRKDASDPSYDLPRPKNFTECKHRLHLKRIK